MDLYVLKVILTVFSSTVLLCLGIMWICLYNGVKLYFLIQKKTKGEKAEKQRQSL
ncbi:hypothetical protein [Priestia megaterium]|uniref:hypothetical protein n=1 Tax=Priestia megaterium TaxID=1404 RepID=UPI0018660678|nr:hypothetical protein [Priestia megaterium]MBE2977796.1 hypothetical protein [Priestia megaterium]